MDIQQILKEIDQKTTRYEMNKGSLKGVLTTILTWIWNQGPKSWRKKDSPKIVPKETFVGGSALPLLLWVPLL